MIYFCGIRVVSYDLAMNIMSRKHKDPATIMALWNMRKAISLIDDILQDD